MTITSRAGLAQCPECDFLFGAAEYLRVLLVEFAIGEQGRGTLTRSIEEAFQCHAVVAGQMIGTNLRSSTTHLRSRLKALL